MYYEVNVTFDEACLILEMLVPGKTNLVYLNLVFVKNDSNSSIYVIIEGND